MEKSARYDLLLFLLLIAYSAINVVAIELARTGVGDTYQTLCFFAFYGPTIFAIVLTLWQLPPEPRPFHWATFAAALVTLAVAAFFNFTILSYAIT